MITPILTNEQKQRIKNYYNRTQYEGANLGRNISNLFSEVNEVYNPINDIVSATISNTIKDLTVENEYLQNEVWKNNRMNELAVKICSALYLFSNVFVEAIVNYNNEIEYLVHDFENIEYEEVEGELHYFSVKGELVRYDETGTRDTVPYERSYYKIYNKGQYKVIKKEMIGGEENTTPFMLDRIPVVKFVYNSTIYEALNIIDRINENDAFIRNIFTIHGDPILQADNVEEFGKTEEEIKTLNDARHKRRVILFTESDEQRKATFKYIELNNAMVKEMLTDIEKQKKLLIDLFPELILVDTTTQNVSSETFDMKNSGLKSKINTFRKAFLLGLVRLDSVALELMHKGYNLTIDNYKFIDVFKEQEKQARLFSIQKSLEILEKMNALGIVEGYEDNVNEIKKEVILEFNALYT